MATVEQFEELEAWKKARELTKVIYHVSSSGEFARDFGLREQICRAAVSIISNIAEGFERDGNKEFLQFLSFAKGSCGEVRAQLYVALDQAYVSSAQFQELIEQTRQVSRLIGGLRKYLQTSQIQGRKYK